ncbi:FliC/FljB family flagellin [Rahnella inusitata]|uniref:FliC/FljB family flagellin n=1 Tax=Rahnella inusitata TaxID=58169 RepID=UPI001BC861EB|nr:FliC/FljB family flagellin [Rahnella inusitata]QUT13345.1 FliC/FljB family flagellin [Rahnella inusitata]
MAQVINTNSLSLMTQNNLNKSQSALGTAIERLSSGLRINSAKDDAAGQAISNRFTSNITGLTQASRNANDGISVAQTTEGSLSEINNNLQRIRELTVQAQNGTNSSSDLDSIQDEITSRLSEIDRVSGQTQFNGVKVLAKDSTMSIQVGANDGETIKIDLKAITADTLKLTGFNVNGAGSVANTAAAKSDLSGMTVGATDATTGAITYTDKVTNASATAANVLSSLKDNDTVTYAGSDTGLGQAASADYTYNATSKAFTFDTAGVTTAQALTYLNPSVGSSTKATVTTGGATGTSQDVIIAKDGSLTASDDGAVMYLDTTGNLTKNNAGGLSQATLLSLQTNADDGGTAVETSIATDKGTFTTLGGTGVSFSVKDASVSAESLAATTTGKAYTATVGGSTDYDVATTGAVTTSATAVNLDSKGALTTATTTDTNYYLQKDGAVTNGSGAAIYKDAAGKLTTDVATTSAATADPLKALDDAIAKVDEFRSSLGAVQNRFDSAITNLNNTTTNLQSAQSRIQDADYATEVSAMSKAQILQQAGTSVLSKANQVPQSVLSLLQ